MRIAASQLAQWIDALANRPDGTGVATLCWAGRHDGIALTLPETTLLLAGIDETSGAPHRYGQSRPP
ncbi:hypothetical protein [Streptomyces sp. TRM49041]|uniref:hypothetical protein n=1 Tax=Streptomyces sp. TRM49041 TaxID=2603216 RepID=UPI0011EE1A97|nr:hypothetical protein [Streptomyces sp. TRM49041]